MPSRYYTYCFERRSTSSLEIAPASVGKFWSPTASAVRWASAVTRSWSGVRGPGRGETALQLGQASAVVRGGLARMSASAAHFVGQVLEKLIGVGNRHDDGLPVVGQVRARDRRVEERRHQ